MLYTTTTTTTSAPPAVPIFDIEFDYINGLRINDSVSWDELPIATTENSTFDFLIDYEEDAVNSMFHVFNKHGLKPVPKIVTLTGTRVELISPSGIDTDEEQDT